MTVAELKAALEHQDPKSRVLIENMAGGFHDIGSLVAQPVGRLSHPSPSSGSWAERAGQPAAVCLIHTFAP